MTTLRVGGAARFYLYATTEEEVVDSIKWAGEREIDVFVLGGGSNLLVGDAGFSGLVIKIGIGGIEQNGDLVTAGAGEDWDQFVEYCIKRRLQGVECLSGIPGLVGGTPVQNVGAYGQEVSESIKTVRVYDRKTDNLMNLSNEECRFGYRTSIFNSSDVNRFVVLLVTFQLKLDGEPKLAYQELIDRVGAGTIDLSLVRDAVCEIRRSKGMLVRQGGPDSQSAGSFFKNPIVSLAKYQEMLEAFGPGVPSFPLDEKQVKIPAAWLIENSGFEKGYQMGNAGLSSKHTLALINRGNASSAEILKLKEEIKAGVRRKFGLELVPEPVFIGI
jgi:UDP-N-acetylmuramate dehydrogenase